MTTPRALLPLALVGLTWACGEPPPTPDTAEATPVEPYRRIALTPEQERGRVIYETVCWSCHGTAGRGDGPAQAAGAVEPPPSFHEGYAAVEPEELERSFQAALEGDDPDHPHMRYVASVVRPDAFRAALAYVQALAYPPELPGSALAGEALYGFRCAGCHGEEGRGDGPAAPDLAVAPPADFTRDSLLASGSWDALLQRIREGGQAVHGSSMPPWGVVLTDAEMWDLAAYLGTFQDGALSDPPWRAGP